jgi:hypothetical protein
LAEKAAWEFVETIKPHFDLVTMLEPNVFGPAGECDAVDAGAEC